LSYNILIEQAYDLHQYEELILEFLRPEEYQITDDPAVAADWDHVDIPVKDFGDHNQVKRMLYMFLAEITGKKPPWGILTGVRPVKLAGEMTDAYGEERAAGMLRSAYLLDDKKADLVQQILKRQRHTFGRPGKESAGIYIGIPFCPSRCLYCSFASNQVGAEEIARYLPALFKEMRASAELLSARGYHAESLYIGGGTPTSLTAEQLDELLTLAEDCFGTELWEETVEAGRPDTIDSEKLEVMAAHRVSRISINPQTMHDATLQRIGRNHTAADTLRAFEAARKAQIRDINMDLIAGLPGETEKDFEESLRQVIELEPENITIHCLAVKRASRLRLVDENYHYEHAGITAAMLSAAQAAMATAGYEPYYLYRQKHMAGSLENIGYTKGGCDSCYNVRIMDEHQTICAMGAGGMSKVYYPEENRLERVPNVTNYEQYIDRIDEMIQRKKDNWNWRK